MRNDYAVREYQEGRPDAQQKTRPAPHIRIEG